MARRRREGLPSGFRSVRDIFTATLGTAGIVHETVFAAQERPTLLIVFAGLLGIPLVLRESDKGGEKSPSPDGGTPEGGDSTDETG